jgi:transposase
MPRDGGCLMAVELLPEGLSEVFEPFIPVVEAKPRRGGRPGLADRAWLTALYSSCAVGFLGRCYRKKWAVAPE